MNWLKNVWTITENIISTISLFVTRCQHTDTLWQLEIAASLFKYMSWRTMYGHSVNTLTPRPSGHLVLKDCNLRILSFFYLSSNIFVLFWCFLMFFFSRDERVKPTLSTLPASYEVAEPRDLNHYLKVHLHCTLICYKY